jgi:hypothetical protein
MITAKQAASQATKYLSELVSLISQPQIEEVELSNDRLTWYITLSYIAQEHQPYAILGHSKSFKIFTIDAESGDIRSMKIRDAK